MTASRKHMRQWQLPWLNVLFACLIAAIIATQAEARPTERHSVSLFVGSSTANDNNLGRGAMFGPRIDRSFLSFLTAQLAIPIAGFKYREERYTLIQPELSLLLGPDIGRFSLYMGLGLGMAYYASHSIHELLTTHVTLGLKVELNSSWDVRTELRGRNLGPSETNGYTDISMGVGYRF